MRAGPLFIAIVACASCAGKGLSGPSSAAVPPPPPADAAIAAIAAIPAVPAIPAIAAIPDARTAAVRGERCGTCADELTCLGLPGGYCASACGAGCDGACVETGTLGPLCLARCTSDADCRASEGYTCDPVWHACSLPNLAAIVPHECPAIGPGIDPSFAASEAIAAGRAPVAAIAEAPAGHASSAPASANGAASASAALAGLVVLFESGGAVASWPSGAILDEDRASAAPAIAATRGALHAAWRTPAGVDLATSTDRGATWTASQPFARSGAAAGAIPGAATAGPAATAAPAALEIDDCGDCSAPPLLAANGETLYALYGGADVGLRARRSRDGGATFEAPVAVAIGTLGSAVVDRAGTLHLATLRGGVHGGYGSAMQTIEYAVGFGPPSVVSGRDELLPTFFATPGLAVDSARRRVWVAYVRGGRDAVWDLVIAASRDGGKTWTRTRIGDGCTVHAVPSIALDPKTGVVHATWYDTQAAPARYAHATCVLDARGTPACTARGAISAPPFAVFGLGRLGPASIGERAALLVDDAHRTLHAFWTQPLADGVHVMHAQAPLR